ncbi:MULTISPECIES: Lrp/AsnC family transcriptional regulator [Ramlibacter]|uniref:Lrp/AsnC family transcriptional regulator n=1 Tax=Ramlibacter aquaticus TaxID=2780094 RepID=A0ABR9SDZ7_9BURK|nr:MULTISPECIES: Lrp/AsnC family transcriptional regulator [Ramlibacter]MBE7940439.1 Lrp/AsnC family transcriptional regulator [Ramlibacter aquaticus]
MQLDRADLKLLELLQRDGRATVQSLSEAIHLSARATLNRVRRLEAAGVIEGYRALVRRSALGEHIGVFAEIALKDQRQAVVQRFERRMAAAPEVLGCWVVSGRYDYLVRIACADLETYNRLINVWLDDSALGVEKIVTNVELQTVKEFAGFPLPGTTLPKRK